LFEVAGALNHRGASHVLERGLSVFASTSHAVNVSPHLKALGDFVQFGGGRFFAAWTASRVSAMISRVGTAPKFVVRTSGRREAVLLDMSQYRRMLRKIEDLEDALALDRAERTSKKLVPYEDLRRRLKRAGKL